MSKEIKEIELDKFDDEFTPIIRVFDDNTSFLIFEFYPPENDKLSEYQIDNLSDILTEISGVKVEQDDTNLFIIYSNQDAILNKIVDFFESL